MPLREDRIARQSSPCKARTTSTMEVSHEVDMELNTDEVERLHEELLRKVDTSKAILKFLEKKLALDEEYANQVRHLCKQQPTLGHSGTAGCFSVLVDMICGHASTTLANLASLTLDAVSPLKAAILQLKSDINDAYVDGKKLQQERKKTFDNFKKAKYIYESIVQDTSVDKCPGMAESDYKFHITVVNNNQNTYYQEHLPKIVMQLQAAENLRATKTYDGIQRYMHFLSDTIHKCADATKVSAEKLNKTALLSSADTEKYRKYCDDLTQPPAEYRFGHEDTEKSESHSPTLSLRNRFLKHGKTASAKWRNSFSVLTSPHRDVTKKIKRQSMPLKPIVHMFGTPLQLLLEHQRKTYPKLDIPYIAYYLVNHLKKIGGFSTENVFRVPGLTVEVQNIKAALENGEFSEDLLFCSVYSTANAFTMWLRELPSPLIPYYMHSHCLGSKTNDELLKIFYGLPSAHVNMLVFLLSFIKDLSQYHETTHMDVDNLAMVFTPSILRSQTSADALTNIEKERQFVISAIAAAGLLEETFPIKLRIQAEELQSSEMKE